MKKKRPGCLGWILIVLGIYLVVNLIGVGVPLLRQKKQEKEDRIRLQQMQEEQEQAEKEAAEAAETYNELFAPLREEGRTCSESASRAVALYFDKDDTEGQFVDRFIPEDWKAESPEDVRYLVHVLYTEKDAGTYMGIGAASAAVQRCYTVRIVDLTDGLQLIEQEFEGTDPPGIISAGQTGYGEYPEDSAVSDWIPIGISVGQDKKALAQEAEAYHEAMTVLLDPFYTCPETATQAVTVFTETVDGEQTETCGKDYLPVGLIAEAPEDVRWLVRCNSKRNVVGTYIIYGNAYQRELQLEIIDLLDGSTVAETSILGPEPPNSVSSEEEATGAYPSNSEVTVWIESILTE